MKVKEKLDIVERRNEFFKVINLGMEPFTGFYPLSV